MPHYIRTMFADACKHPDGKRQRETDIINQLFTKKGKRLEMDQSKPLFEEGLKAYNREYIKYIEYIYIYFYIIKDYILYNILCV